MFERLRRLFTFSTREEEAAEREEDGPAALDDLERPASTRLSSYDAATEPGAQISAIKVGNLTTS